MDVTPFCFEAQSPQARIYECEHCDSAGSDHCDAKVVGEAPRVNFKGKGELPFEQLAALEEKLVHDVHYAFNTNGWINHQIYLGLDGQHLHPKMRKAAHPCIVDRVLLLLDNCGTCHHSDEVEKLTADNGITVFWGPANLTSRWHPCDAAMLQTCKTRSMEDDGLRNWLDERCVQPNDFRHNANGF